jgi:hypothetical protein
MSYYSKQLIKALSKLAEEGNLEGFKIAEEGDTMLRLHLGRLFNSEID